MTTGIALVRGSLLTNLSTSSPSTLGSFRSRSTPLFGSPSPHPRPPLLVNNALHGDQAPSDYENVAARNLLATDSGRLFSNERESQSGNLALISAESEVN